MLRDARLLRAAAAVLPHCDVVAAVAGPRAEAATDPAALAIPATAGTSPAQGMV